MRFEALPHIPESWIHFTDGRHPELPGASIPAILQAARSDGNRYPLPHTVRDKCLQLLLGDSAGYPEPVRANIQKLLSPDSVVVVAGIEPDLFGGTVAQFLKCLTAAKLCRRIDGHSVKAVPVCWIRASRDGLESSDRSVSVLDGKRQLLRICLKDRDSGASASGCTHSYGSISDLVAGIEALGQGKFDAETLRCLENSYFPPVEQRANIVRIMMEFLSMWGVVVIDSRIPAFREAMKEEYLPAVLDSADPHVRGREIFTAVQSEMAAADYCVQYLLMNANACVLGREDLEAFILSQSLLNAVGRTPPIAWPATSATLVDPDSRRTFRKYSLRLEDLFAGKDEILERLAGTLPDASIGNLLQKLRSEAGRCIDALDDPVLDYESFRKAKVSGRKRIEFQLNKIRNRFESARLQKMDVMRRRVGRTCASLAPEGKIQEQCLSGIYFLLRYSRDLLPQLYESMDIERFEHQTIEIY